MEIFSKEMMEVVGQTLASLGDNAQNAFIAYLGVPVLIELVYWVGLCAMLYTIFHGVVRVVQNKPEIAINKPVKEVLSKGADANLIRDLRLCRDQSHISYHKEGEIYSTVHSNARAYIERLESAAGEQVVAKLRKEIFYQE